MGTLGWSSIVGPFGSVRGVKGLLVASVSLTALLAACGTANDEARPPEVRTTVTVTSSGGERAGQTDASTDVSLDRTFSQVYQVRLDPDRTLLFELNGQFSVTEDKSDAPAGKTRVFVHSTGSAKITNVSEGRDTEPFGHGIELFLPVHNCPNWSKNVGGDVGEYCSYDLFNIEAPSLSPNDPHNVYMDDVNRVDEVSVKDAPQVMAAILSQQGVMLSADRVFISQELEKLNPICKLPDGGEWITYFSESDSVNACSTELMR